MSRPRIGEVRAITKLLEMEWSDMTDLVKAIIEAVDEERAKRDTYAGVMLGSGQVYLFGPYGTLKQGEKEMGRLTAPNGSDWRCGVRKLYPVNTGDDKTFEEEK